MTPSPSMLPVSGEQHEKAREAAARERFAQEHTGLAWDDHRLTAAEAIVAAYFASLAAQGVRLVDVREVAEWLRYEYAPVCGVADEFLARFGGGDER